MRSPLRDVSRVLGSVSSTKLEAELAHTEITPPLTGRCYCGAHIITASKRPLAVTYCHCRDCRRVTGGPVAVFAAFEGGDVTITPNAGREITITAGVTRTFCDTCGSPLTGRYDYLAGTVYIPLGLLDQADDYPPDCHAHEASKIAWLNIEDDLVRHPCSARSQLNKQTLR